MKKNILLIVAVLLTTAFVNSQSLQVQNSRTIIENLGNQIVDLNFRIDTSDIKELGFKKVDDLNLIGINKPTHISNVTDFKSHLGGKFYNFEYDKLFIIQTANNANVKTLNNNPEQNIELYYTIRALEILKIRYSNFYQKLILSIINPQLQNSDQNSNTNWYNCYSKIIISFNTGSSDVAISGTYLDQAPIAFSLNEQQMSLFENFPIISINSESIKGTNQLSGSYPIYKKPNPQDDYLLYLKEGLLHSICHELIHRYIDINNNRKGTIFNYISFGNGRKNRDDAQYDKNLYNIEEVIVNRTLDTYFTKNGGISSTLLTYYLQVEIGLLNAVINLNAYKTDLMTKTFINNDLSVNL